MSYLVCVEGPSCTFCEPPKTLMLQVDSETPRATVATLMDTCWERHLMSHVDDFLYGMGGVFPNVPLDRRDCGVRPPDPSA